MTRTMPEQRRAVCARLGGTGQGPAHLPDGMCRADGGALLCRRELGELFVDAVRPCNIGSQQRCVAA
jgi:hypothetical protein